MADIPSGTIFAAIAPNTDVDKKSALINEKSLTYTIEDIAAAAGGDLDLSEYLKIVDAEDTYQPISGMSSYLTSADAMGIYQTIAGMSSYLTSADAMGIYQPISDMANYLTTAAAASYYQAKFNVDSTVRTLTLNQNVSSSGSAYLGTINVGAGKNSGRISVQTGSGFVWSKGGLVFFFVNYPSVFNNSRIFLTSQGFVQEQIVVASVISQTEGSGFMISMLNMYQDTQSLDQLQVNWMVVNN
jgi:hypothetical protein